MQSIENDEQFKNYLDQLIKELNSFFDMIPILYKVQNMLPSKEELFNLENTCKLIQGKSPDVNSLVKALEVASTLSVVKGDVLIILEKLKEKINFLRINALFFTGLDVAKILSTDNMPIKCIKEDNFDLVIKVERDKTLPPNYPQEIRAGEFYFDRTDLPIYLRSPEILDVLAKKCCIRSTETTTGWDLKQEYKNERSVAPNNDPFMHSAQRIKLTDSLVNAIYKALTEKEKGHKYALIGPTDYRETEEQRIENFLITGRSDRVVGEGATGPSEEHTVSIILKEEKKNIKTVRVMKQSFPRDGKYERVSKYNRWVRVVVD